MRVAMLAGCLMVTLTGLPALAHAAAAPARPLSAIVLGAATAPTSGSGQPAAKPPLPQDALLLVIDAFNVVRMLEDDEFAAKRDEIARNLLRNLIPFLRPEKAQSKPSAVTAPPAPKPAKPATVKPAVGGSGRAPSKPKPASATSKPKPPSATKPAPKPHGPASAYAKVPQKRRIKRKFAAARDPFKKLQQQDPAKAAVVGELLKAARAALARQQFDSAETYIDHALEMMGVPKPK